MIVRSLRISHNDFLGDRVFYKNKTGFRLFRNPAHAIFRRITCRVGVFE